MLGTGILEVVDAGYVDEEIKALLLEPGEGLKRPGLRHDHPSLAAEDTRFHSAAPGGQTGEDVVDSERHGRHGRRQA